MDGVDRTGRIHGIDAAELRGYIDSVAADPTLADRNPVVVARWLGGSRAEVTSAQGGPAVYIGGDDEPSAMGMLVRALAACDVEVVVNAAALLGVEIDELTIESRGHFNVARFLGFDADQGSGFQAMSYTVRLKTRGATQQQIDAIVHACEAGSPVADTLRRQVPISAEFDIS